MFAPAVTQLEGSSGTRIAATALGMHAVRMADKPRAEDFNHAELPPFTFLAPWVGEIFIDGGREDVAAASTRRRDMTPSLTALYLLGFGLAVAGGFGWYIRRRK